MVVFTSHKSTSFFFVFLCVAALGSVFMVWQKNAINGFLVLSGEQVWESPKLRPVVFNLTDFGGVGDGVTLNTQAFERAVSVVSKFGDKGGAQLNVPPGFWLTAPFNLTSHMTLFLAHEAVILGIQDEKYWPLMPALPSYGYGREHPGPRYSSLIHGQHLKDVVITGHNGTINGQGQTWWTKHLNHYEHIQQQFTYQEELDSEKKKKQSRVAAQIAHPTTIHTSSNEPASVLTIVDLSFRLMSSSSTYEERHQ